MSNILATNPRLEDLIRKQVNEYGLNHGRISDNQGMVIDNEGNSTRYVGSNGRHPSRTNTPNITSGWHRTLNEKTEMEEDCGGTHEEDWEMDEDCGRKHELQEELPCGVFTRCRWQRIKDEVQDAIDEVNCFLSGGCSQRPPDDPSTAGYSQNLEMGEATSSGGASGSYVAPLDFDETEEIIEGVMRDEVNKIINEQQEELHEMPTCYSWCYGHGGWCEGKYGPCNIPDRGSFDSVADIPKGGVKGDDQHIVHGKGSGFKQSLNEEKKSCAEQGKTGRCHKSGWGGHSVTGCYRDTDDGGCECKAGWKTDCGPTSGSVRGGNDSITHGKGSGFKTPQGGSERLETFNRRQMKESLKNRVIDRILNEREELTEKTHCWYRRTFRGNYNGCIKKRCGTTSNPGSATQLEAMPHCDGGSEGSPANHENEVSCCKMGIGSSTGGVDNGMAMNDRRRMNEADVPGISITKKTLKKAKSENNAYLKSVDKKMKEYLNFKGNSHPEFPHQNNSKTDYKSPMYRNTQEDEDFIDDFRGMGLQDANGVETLDRIDDYLNGSTKTGNSQDAANVIPSTLGSRLKKNMKRKKEKIAKRKSKMTNLRGITPDVQTVTNIKESKDISRMKQLIGHKMTGQ